MYVCFKDRDTAAALPDKDIIFTATPDGGLDVYYLGEYLQACEEQRPAKCWRATAVFVAADVEEAAKWINDVAKGIRDGQLKPAAAAQAAEAAG